MSFKDNIQDADRRINAMSVKTQQNTMQCTQQNMSNNFGSGRVETFSKNSGRSITESADITNDIQQE